MPSVGDRLFHGVPRDLGVGQVTTNAEGLGYWGKGRNVGA